MGLREEHFAIFPSIFLLFCLVFHWSAFNVGEVTTFFFFFLKLHSGWVSFMPHWGKVKEKLKNEVLSLGISIFCVHLFPSHLSLNWAARKSLGVFWEDWGLLNREEHQQRLCTLALDAAHSRCCWRRWKGLTLLLVAHEKETPKRKDVVGIPATAEGNVSLQNCGLKGNLEVLSPAQSRANLGQAAQGCSLDASRAGASSRLSPTTVNIFPCN